MKRNIEGHYLRANHKGDIPTNIIVLDTETKPISKGEVERHRMVLGWTVYADRTKERGVIRERWTPWDSPFKLWKYIDAIASSESAIWLFGNNIYFDLQASDFFYYMPRFGWRDPFLYDSSLTFILVLHKGRHVLRILSVTNYWSASVRELGELLSRHKADPDFDTVSPDDLLSYCFRDTEIAFDALERYWELIDKHDLGTAAMSRAGQAMRAYRHRFMPLAPLIHNDDEIQELEGSAYMGGRVECYQLGPIEGGPFVELDVNSMYPYIMSRYKLPTEPVNYRTDVPIAKAMDLIQEFSIIAKVELETDLPLYAYRCHGKLIFPIGGFTTFLCTEGLRQALIRGHVREIKRLVTYHDGILFRDYVDHFYALRAKARSEGDLILDKLCKLMLNSLYGKFAQKNPIVVETSDCDPEAFSRISVPYHGHKGEHTTTELFGKRTVTNGERYSKGSIVSIPAHITEYGRMLLWSIIEGIGIERVIYCDTDSIWIRKSDLERLQYPIESSKLGALKVACEYSSLEIYGPKDYRADEVTKLKGVPSRAKHLQGREYEYPTFTRMSTHLARGEKRSYIIQITRKSVGQNYDKGRVNVDLSVSPWRLPGDLLAPELQF